MASRNRLLIVACVKPDGMPKKVIGRDAWALLQLVSAGPRGCTPLTHVGPRWSHYVWKLRRAGFVVETVDEPHGGQFAGHHARYILRSDVEILNRSDIVTKREAA